LPDGHIEDIGIFFPSVLIVYVFQGYLSQLIDGHSVDIAILFPYVLIADE
jgi:hypothetical protein